MLRYDPEGKFVNDYLRRLVARPDG
jgi:hypothetical protein